MGAYLRDAEHFDPDLYQLLFKRVARCHEIRVQFRPGQAGRVKSQTVQLAVRRQRQRIQHHERGWHHVVRQLVLEKVAQFTCRGHLLRLRNYVSYQLFFTALVFMGHHGGFLNLGQAAQCQLDLGDLDSEASNLHPKIVTPCHHQTAIWLHVAQISRAIDPFALIVGVGCEGRPCEIRLVPITRRDVATLDRDYTDLVESYRFAIVVEQQDLYVPERVSDRHHSIAYLGVLVDAIPQHAGRFGSAVRVNEDGIRREVSLVELNVFRRDRFAAQPDQA